MTAVVEAERRISQLGPMKIMVIQSDAACATNHTIDLKSDSQADQAFKEVRLTLVQDDAGSDKDSTWNPSTGIITLGTLSTGIHNITIIGI